MSGRTQATRDRAQRQDDPAASAVAVRAQTPEQQALARIGGQLEERRSQFLELLSGDERMVDRIRTVALHSLANPKLLAKLVKADPATVIEAVRESAALGLMPIGAMGEGYLIPYWNRDKALYDFKFLPGYRGLLKLIDRGGRVASVMAHVVFEADEIDLQLGSTPRIEHRPALGKRGNRVGVYAVARLRSGEPDIEWMPVAEIELVRRSSKAADEGPWIDWYDEMARKSVIRRLAKRLPIEYLAERAISIENEAEEFYRRAPGAANGGQPVRGLRKVRDLLGVSLDDVAEAGQEEAAATAPATQEGSGDQEPPSAGAAPATPSAGAEPAAPDPTRPFTADEVDEVLAESEPPAPGLWRGERG